MLNIKWFPFAFLKFTIRRLVAAYQRRARQAEWGNTALPSHSLWSGISFACVLLAGSELERLCIPNSQQSVCTCPNEWMNIKKCFMILWSDIWRSASLCFRAWVRCMCLRSARNSTLFNHCWVNLRKILPLEYISVHRLTGKSYQRIRQQSFHSFSPDGQTGSLEVTVLMAFTLLAAQRPDVVLSPPVSLFLPYW